MSEDLLVALDVGTGGARATVYDECGARVAAGAAAYRTFYDRPGWAEQDPEQWWTAAAAALTEALSRPGLGRRVRAIGLTGQSPTVAPVDADGFPLRRGLLYQDNRATREAERWSDPLGGSPAVHAICGHDPAAFHIGPKILWLREHEPSVFARTRFWLQPRDFVARHLTGECATDWSHAGSTLLFDIERRDWCPEALAAHDIPAATFPPALPPWTVAGAVRPEIADQWGLARGTAVVIGGADSQCCAAGAGVLESFQLSDMAGSSTCLNMPVKRPVNDLRVSNYCHVVPDLWCTELGLNSTGLSFEWLVRLFSGRGEALRYEEMESAAAAAPPGSDGILFLPYMAEGERFDPELRGAFAGLSLRHGPGQLARAVLEGVAFAIRALVDTMAEAGAPVKEIHVSGGGARSDLWNQIKADVIGVPVAAAGEDATSLGAALLAGFAVGTFSSPAEAAARCVRFRRRYDPDFSLADVYGERYLKFRALMRPRE
jgi:xylulokinase